MEIQQLKNARADEHLENDLKRSCQDRCGYPDTIHTRIHTGGKLRPSDDHLSEVQRDSGKRITDGLGEGNWVDETGGSRPGVGAGVGTGVVPGFRNRGLSLVIRKERLLQPGTSQGLQVNVTGTASATGVEATAAGTSTAPQLGLPWDQAFRFKGRVRLGSLGSLGSEAVK